MLTYLDVDLSICPYTHTHTYNTGMSILCSDKTGTLTLNKMMIQEETPIYIKVRSRFPSRLPPRLACPTHNPTPPDKHNTPPVYTHTHAHTQGETQYTVLRYAAMASKWNEPARDALDTLVHGCADLASLRDVQQVGKAEELDGELIDGVDGGCWIVGCGFFLVCLVG